MSDELIARQRDTWMLCCRNAEKARDEAIEHRERAEAERDSLRCPNCDKLRLELGDCQKASKWVMDHRDALHAENDALRALVDEVTERWITDDNPRELPELCGKLRVATSERVKWIIDALAQGEKE